MQCVDLFIFIFSRKRGSKDAHFIQKKPEGQMSYHIKPTRLRVWWARMKTRTQEDTGKAPSLSPGCFRSVSWVCETAPGSDVLVRMR